MRPLMATERTNHEPGPMPTTTELVQEAAAKLAPILGPNFFGRFTLIFESGKPLRWERLESGKL